MQSEDAPKLGGAHPSPPQQLSADVLLGQGCCPLDAHPSIHASSVMLKVLLLHGLILLFVLPRSCRPMPTISDQSVKAYLTERTCWWNEICKEEFQNQFKCKCPMWSYCRSEGRYYSAYCSMTNTGYIWTQPERTWSVPIQPRSALAPTS